MAKLVDEPRYLATFMPKILPLLDAAKENVSDPECREVCGVASDTLTKKAAGAKPLSFDIKVATETCNKAIADLASSKARKPELETVFAAFAFAANQLNEVNEYDAAVWKKLLSRKLIEDAGIDAAKADEIVESVRAVAEASRVVKEEEEIDDDAEVLCDLPFGLAYGNKVLLRKTRLKLLRGHKYGLLGQNDSGKTSLLNALADYDRGLPYR